jgi:hypothetical protein
MKHLISILGMRNPKRERPRAPAGVQVLQLKVHSSIFGWLPLSPVTISDSEVSRETCLMNHLRENIKEKYYLVCICEMSSGIYENKTILISFKILHDLFSI